MYQMDGSQLQHEVNEVFKPIPRLNCISESDKNKQGSISAALSNFVGSTGCDLKRSRLDCFIREAVRET
jgi:hypothetical protein